MKTVDTKLMDSMKNKARTIAFPFAIAALLLCLALSSHAATYIYALSGSGTNTFLTNSVFEGNTLLSGTNTLAGTNNIQGKIQLDSLQGVAANELLGSDAAGLYQQFYGAGIGISISGGAVKLNNPLPAFDGTALTNLTYAYRTNPITALTINYGQAYFTNIGANISILLGSPETTFFKTAILVVTNSSGTDFSVTFPNGVWGTPGSGAPPVYWCTNKMLTRFNIEHYGAQITNAYKLDFAP